MLASAAQQVRPPTDTIAAPPFPARAQWLNSDPLSMRELRGRAVLIEFWDFCRPNSLHTLPYMKAWHERYAEAGLTVVGVHTPGFRASANEQNVREAVAALRIDYPVMLDTDFSLWTEYENIGWPARYLWNGVGLLDDYHLGEGGYTDSELAIQELTGVSREPLAALRPEDDRDAMLVVPSDERREPPWSGPYEAGGVWAVLEPRRAGTPGVVSANGREVLVGRAGAYPLLAHERSERGELVLEIGPGVRCDGVCFTPGLATPERA
jgi:hypothetical protein